MGRARGHRHVPGDSVPPRGSGRFPRRRVHGDEHHDAGAGSLRQAIVDANLSPGVDTIQFATLPQLGPIVLATPLPDITDPVIIDATTHPAYVDRPVVEVRGR